MACTSSGSSTTQIVVPSRSSLAHAAHGLASAMLKHVEQKTVLVFRLRSASASDSATPEASLIRKYVSREADFGPMPGSCANASISRVTALGVVSILAERRQAQPARQALDLLRRIHLRSLDRLVDGGDDQVLQHLDVARIDDFRGKLDRFETLLAGDDDCDRATARRDFDRLVGQRVLRLGHFVLQLLELRHQVGGVETALRHSETTFFAHWVLLWRIAYRLSHIAYRVSHIAYRQSLISNLFVPNRHCSARSPVSRTLIGLVRRGGALPGRRDRRPRCSVFARAGRSSRPRRRSVGTSSSVPTSARCAMAARPAAPAIDPTQRRKPGLSQAFPAGSIRSDRASLKQRAPRPPEIAPARTGPARESFGPAQAPPLAPAAPVDSARRRAPIRAEAAAAIPASAPTRPG